VAVQQTITGLLVFDKPETLHALKVALQGELIEVWTARTCSEAGDFLKCEEQVPPLVFTDIQFPDGTWVDILLQAQEASEPVNVIVVSTPKEVGFYVQAFQWGAFDFLAPPFGQFETAHVVRTAAANVLRQRQDQNRLVSASLD
jgi:DNA-binding NtrC family response regulator